MSRRRFVISLALVLGVLFFKGTSEAAPDDLVIVINEKNGASPDLAATKRLFMGETAFWSSNVAVHLFIRPHEAPASAVFYRAIGVAPARFRRLWQEKQLSGQGSPPEIAADAAALIARVASDGGAIGFALAQELPPNPAGVRVVTVN